MMVIGPFDSQDLLRNTIDFSYRCRNMRGMAIENLVKMESVNFVLLRYYSGYDCHGELRWLDDARRIGESP